MSLFIHKHFAISIITCGLVLLFASPFNVFAQANLTCNPSLIHQITVRNDYISLGNLSWSPDGRYILALYVQGNENGSAIAEGLSVIDGATFEILHDIERSLSSSIVDAILWSPDSQQVAIANANLGTVELWNVADWTSFILEVPDTDEGVMQMVWSEDSSQLGVVSHDRMRTWPLREPGEVVRIWDVATRQVLETLGSSTETVSPSLVKARLSYANGRWLVATLAEAETQVQVSFLGEAETLLEVPANDLADFVNTVSGVRLAVVQIPSSDDQSQGILNVWNVDRQTPEFALSGRANSLAISRLFPENDLVTAPISILEYIVHDLSADASFQFEQLGVFPSPNGALIASVERGIGGSATVTITGDVFITNSLSGETIATFPGDPISTLDKEWSPNSQSLAVSGYSGELSIWSLDSCL